MLDTITTKPGAQQRAARISKAMRYKASPTRIRDAGHTGVMVALLPSTATAQQLTVLPGVTEVAEDLHLTLAYLGDSTEVPLATNKERVCQAFLEWSLLHPAALYGTINGVGRFYHMESDNTNAVYVAPDLAALPTLRQSLTDWIEQSGFDYSQDHGFTPHITVAYVPADDPTPPIRVNIPAVFDRLLLAWGDEQYEVPLIGPQAATIKAPNYGARAGQTIVGGLARGGDGKFASGGSGSATPPASAPKGKQPKKTPAQRLAERNATRAARIAAQAATRENAKQETYRKLGIAPDGQAALEGLRKGENADSDAIARAGLEDAGLVARDSTGVYHLTASGRATVNAATQGDTGRAGDTIAAARDRLQERRARFAERLGKRQSAAAEAPKAGGGGGGGGGKKPEPAGMSTADALALMRRSAGLKSTLTIFKDATGHDRWLAISSTAYRDRDGEIVSCKALQQAVATGDTSQQRGPLRFWHVPSLDIGDCDYQATAQDGRFLVESGTFRTPAYAQAVKARGAGYQMSIGFVHPASQPDHQGIFTDIAIFERSLVPPGMASNPFTTITTKEQRMLSSIKLTALKDLLGDTPELAALLAQVQTTDKAAQAQGVAFKDASDAETITLNGVTYARLAEKAPPPPPAVEPPVAASAPEAGLDVTEAATDDASDEAFLDAIADRVVSKLMPVLDMEKKMQGHVNDIKASFGGMAATKDAEIATIKAQQAQLDQRLKELEGEQPATRTTYRATDDPALVVGVAQGSTDPFADINQKLFGIAPTS